MIKHGIKTIVSVGARGESRSSGFQTSVKMILWWLTVTLPHRRLGFTDSVGFETQAWGSTPFKAPCVIPSCGLPRPLSEQAGEYRAYNKIIFTSGISIIRPS